MAEITRIDNTTALIVLTPPTGFSISTVNALQLSTVNCTALVNGDNTVTLTIVRDRAYAIFSGDAITITGSNGTFQVGVTFDSPTQVPLACTFCNTTKPMTNATYARLIRGRATAAGPGPDVRIVARRAWGDDFAGCNVCNH